MSAPLDNIQINSRGLKMTDAIQDYIYKKLEFLDKYTKYITNIAIEVIDTKSESSNIKYEITIAVKKEVIRVEESGNDLYALVDKVHDTLKVKLDKYKEKFTDHTTFKTSEEIEEEILVEDENVDTYYEPKITKRVIYSDNKPLSPQEAITQMELLGHNSFLFKNIENNKYSMIFRLEDGNYGLVEPENI